MQELSTKEKILAAARKLFVEHGFAGTSMGKIAKLADVNHSLIFHHFTNKEQLWVAVKHNIIGETNQVTHQLPDINLPFNQFLKELFSQYIKFYRSNQDVVRMINWQRLEPDAQIGVTYSATTQAWIDSFKHYQQQGDIDKKLKPEFIITLILGIITSAALDPNVFIKEEQNFQAYIDFSVNSLIKAWGTNR